MVAHSNLLPDNVVHVTAATQYALDTHNDTKSIIYIKMVVWLHFITVGGYKPELLCQMVLQLIAVFISDVVFLKVKSVHITDEDRSQLSKCLM